MRKLKLKSKICKPLLSSRGQSQSKIQNLKSKIKLAGAATLIGWLFLAQPARAIIGELLRIIDVMEDYFPEVAIVSDWIDTLQTTIANPCAAQILTDIVPVEPGWCRAVEEAVGGDLSSLIETATGALGIPNPLEIRVEIGLSALEAGTSDPFTPNPVVYSSFRQNLGDRALTLLNVSGTLGAGGQAATEENLAQISQLVAQTASEADSAQLATATQDVVKSMVKMQAMEAALAQIQHGERIRARIDHQFTNLNLANISRSLDGQNRRERAIASGNALKGLALSGQPSLF